MFTVRHLEKHKRRLFIFLSQKDLLSGVKIHIMPLLMESLSKDLYFYKKYLVKLIPAIDLKNNKCVRLTQGKEQSAKNL